MDASWSALILDDDPGVRQSVRLCLEPDNARVLGVGTSTGALGALERSRFDVVFLDLWLQAESGLTLLPEILRRQPGIGVIVIRRAAGLGFPVGRIGNPSGFRGGRIANPSYGYTIFCRSPNAKAQPPGPPRATWSQEKQKWR